MKYIAIVLTLLLTACGDNNPNKSTQTTPISTAQDVRANVIGVDVSGNTQAYTFAVTLASDETGCEQYADWWEVLAEDGSLIYRRILFHSHPSEQPFTRSGGSITIDATQSVYVRAHMNNVGYNGDVYKGSVQHGFSKSDDTIAQSDSVILQEPQPNGCAF